VSETTAISWTDKTWNPWQGCHRVSPGCAHCYMHTEKKRYGQDPTTVVRSKPPTFNAPKKWKEPAKVFTCSWSDFFIEEADPWRAEAWDIIRATPWLTYQIVTKRPERIASCLPADWGKGWPNVWLGTTVESQAAADTRVPLLLGVQAAVHFLSCEPLLGPVDLHYPAGVFPGGPEMCCDGMECGCQGGPAEPPLIWGIDWVICGGESGPGARPMDVEWARSLRKQCPTVTAFWMKQLGGHPNKRHNLEDLPDDLRIRQFPETL
jgi:protein gp37